MSTKTASRTGAVAGAATLELVTVYWAVAGSMSAASLAVAAVFLALLGAAVGAIAGSGLAATAIAVEEAQPQEERYEERLAA